MIKDTKQTMREAFERLYFGAGVPVIERAGDGYKFAAPNDAWWVWKAAWNASNKAALEAAAKLCEAERDRTLNAQTTSGDTTTDLMLRQVAHLGFDASAAAIRAEIDK